MSQADLFTYRGMLFFSPSKLRDYLNQKNTNGSFGSTVDLECIVSLHLRKIYELYFENKSELVIGFELQRDGEDKVESLPDSFESVEHSMEKFTEADTLTDIKIPIAIYRSGFICNLHIKRLPILSGYLNIY